MWKRKRGDEGKQTLDMKIYPVVSVGTKPPLVHVVEALAQEYYFPITKSLPGHPLTYHKGSATKVHAKFPDHLDVVSTKELLHEVRGLHVPRTQSSTPLHTKPEGRRLAGELLRLQGAGTPCTT